MRRTPTGGTPAAGTSESGSGMTKTYAHRCGCRDDTRSNGRKERWSGNTYALPVSPVCSGAAFTSSMRYRAAASTALLRSIEPSLARPLSTATVIDSASTLK
ncbi:hypothetical protein FFI94_010825 [Rhodococcus sp. KBS0724]|nr:hypothetical protein FFI94_010825 [Rhodococcus sp. KBS0724]